jgi:beta-xylosidase
MIEALKLWNEPNNLAHWDFRLDVDWVEFSQMVRHAAAAIKEERPALKVVLGGLSPIDPVLLKRLAERGTLDQMDAVAIHGFPVDWNLWPIEDWPEKVQEIRAVTHLPVWVTEVGVSSFGSEQIQVFGLKLTTELLCNQVDQIFWYSLLDLPQNLDAISKNGQNEGSDYHRHFHMGLLRADGTPKAAAHVFDPRLGICQWFQFEDARLDLAVEWLRKLGVKKLRTGISWADWHRPNATVWFDRQMEALREFDTTVTLCYTPPSRGKKPHHTSPPQHLTEFADFARWVVKRYT